MGSKSGSLHSDCQEKQHLSLSSSTESLTPQKEEGQRETLLSIYLYPQLVSGMCLWLEGSLDCVPVTPLICLFKQLSIDSELPVLTAVKNLSNCKKKKKTMAWMCLEYWPYLF